jgi:hypothetical protein
MYEFVDRSFKSSQQNHVCVLFFLQVCLNKWVCTPKTWWWINVQHHFPHQKILYTHHIHNSKDAQFLWADKSADAQFPESHRGIGFRWWIEGPFLRMGIYFQRFKYACIYIYILSSLLFFFIVIYYFQPMNIHMGWVQATSKFSQEVRTCPVRSELSGSDK